MSDLAVVLADWTRLTTRNDILRFEDNSRLGFLNRKTLKTLMNVVLPTVPRRENCTDEIRK